MSRPGDMHQADEAAAQPPRWDGPLAVVICLILGALAGVWIK